MPDVADTALPVWTVLPNWSEGVRERLDWLTDIIASSDGNEQRRAMRLSPRRSFECLFNPIDEDRSYFELWLHRLSAAEFMVPLWHDAAPLTVSRVIGNTVLTFDNTNREFVVGGLAVIIGGDAQTWEKVSITAQTNAGITIAAPGLVNAWPAGTKVYPLRRTRLGDQSQLEAVTTRVGAATLVFELNQGNDIPDEGVWTGLTYDGLPVITTPPNYSETISTDYMRLAFALDNEQGLRYLADDAGRAFTVQAHSWQMRGRTEHAAFRQMLYRLRGMSQPVYVPTFNQDIRLARSAASGNSYLHVKKIGYSYTGGAVGGRTKILINGTILATVSGTGAALAVNEERLNLSAPVGANFTAGVSASFLAASRLNQDSVEIMHYTDTDGMAECKLAFRQFKNTRTAPAVIDNPIPASVFGSTFCGSSDDLICVNMHEFTGIYYFFKLEVMPVLGTYYPSTPGCYWNNVTDGYGRFMGGVQPPLADGVWFDPPLLAPVGHSGSAAYNFNGWNAYSSHNHAPGSTWDLRLQFDAGGVWETADHVLNWCRLSYRKWDQDNFTIVTPTTWPSSHPLKGGGWFEVSSLLPYNWGFIF